MEGNKVHFRHLMLFYYRKGKNAAQTRNKICSIYGNGAISESTVRKWFSQFKIGNCALETARRSGRSSVVNDIDIKMLIENNPRYTTREIADILKISKTTVNGHLKSFGYVHRYGVWVPQTLTEQNLIDRISICDLLIKRNEDDPFLKRLVTGGEKLLSYNKITRKRSSAIDEESEETLKDDSQPTKIMLYIWWDWRGILYYDLVPYDQGLNSDLYSSQLDRLNMAIQEKRPDLSYDEKGVVFHQGNARMHLSVQSRMKLIEFGWDLLPHPSNSPDLAPTDYYLSRSIKTFLNDKNIDSIEECKTTLDRFFAQKDRQFFENGVIKLTSRWEKVLQREGNYIIE